jgi:ribosomal protein S18 acetylase RimI-like enzyme
LRELGIDEFAREVGRLRGSPTGQIAAHAARMAASPSSRQARRLALIDGGHVVAAGQAVREFELVGLYDIATAEHARGRGLATALTIELLQRASQDGAGTAYLQVSADNAAARHLYGKLGFVDRYVYWYRAEPDAAEPQQR